MIKVQIMGIPQVFVDGVPLSFPYKKVEGAFYYLCVCKQTTRQALIQTLWGEGDEVSGRKSLREALYRLKKMFGDDLITTQGNVSISLNPSVALEVDWDVVTDEELLKREDLGLFTHFYIKNSFEFDQWKETLTQQYNQRYCHIAREHLFRNPTQVPLQQRYREALLRHDPFNEDRYRRVMEFFLENNQWSAAVTFYQDLADTLQRELQVTPSPPVQALWMQAVNQNSPQGNFHFLGRKEELTDLQLILEDFVQGISCRNLIFMGEPGVGKTKLLAQVESLTEDSEVLVFSASAFANEDEFFLKLWFDLFQNMVEFHSIGVISDQQVGEAFLRLNRILSGEALLDAGLASVTYQTISHQMTTLFTHLSQQIPIVLVLDDLQWADAMSISVLCRLLTSYDKRVLCLGSALLSYEQEISQRFTPIISKNLLNFKLLHPFSPEESKEYVLSVLPGTTPKEMQAIFEKSQGNPFYLTELTLFLLNDGDFEGIPPKITSLLEHRLVHLSPTENDLLDCLSIFSQQALPQELQPLMELPLTRILDCLEQLKRKHLLEETITSDQVYFYFRHHYLWQFLYQRQGEAKRKIRHGILAETYSREKGNLMAHLPLIIYHYGKCGNQYQYFRHRVTYLKQFHSIAYENFPLLRRDVDWNQDCPSPEGGAKELLDLAKEILDWEDNRGSAQALKMEMHYSLGRHLISMGQYKKGLNHLNQCQQLAEALEDRVTQTLCWKQRVFYGIQIEDITIMEEGLAKGLALLRPEDEPDQHATFLRLQGVLHLLQGQYTKAEQFLGKSATLFRQLESPERHYSINIAACISYQGDIYGAQGNFSQALTFYQRAIRSNSEAVVTNGLGQFWVQKGQALIRLNRYAEAQQALSQARTCFHHYDSAWGRGKLEILQCMVYFHNKEYTRAETHFKRAAAIERRIQNPSNLAMIQKMEVKLYHYAHQNNQKNSS